jgi:hypothetical protein
MPNYNKDWKGMVKLKDITNYKDGHYSLLDKEERMNYTLDDLEYEFPRICFEVQDFGTFLAKLPASSFDKGIKREQVISLFEEYEYFIKRLPGDYADFSDDKYKQLAVNLGLLEVVDQSHKTATELWAELKPATLREICATNNVEASGKSASMIKRLIEQNIKFPYQVLRPTELLRQCHGMFVDMYIDQIRTNADHFHPLYFKPLWEEVCRINYLIDDLERKVKDILKTRYWNDRLCKAVRL